MNVAYQKNKNHSSGNLFVQQMHMMQVKAMETEQLQRQAPATANGGKKSNASPKKMESQIKTAGIK